MSLFFEPGANSNVGAGLSAKGAGQLAIFGDWHTAFAGKPAATGDTLVSLFFEPGGTKCWGAGFTCERVGQLAFFAAAHTAFAGKPGSTGDTW